jgi:hypothetical protein
MGAGVGTDGSKKWHIVYCLSRRSLIKRCCQFLSGSCFVFQSLHTSSGILSHASDGSVVKAVHIATFLRMKTCISDSSKNFILVPSCDFTPHSSSKQNALPVPIIPKHRRGFEQVTFTIENSFDEWFVPVSITPPPQSPIAERIGAVQRGKSLMRDYVS